MIRAGGSEASLRAGKRSWLVSSSELSGTAEDPTCWLHVRPRVSATSLLERIELDAIKRGV